MVVEELHGYEHEFEVSFVEYNRTAVGGPEGVSMGKSAKEAGKNFMEKRELSSELRELVLTTAMAELELLAKADMLIGTSSSTIGRLALMAQVGQLGFVPPFVFVDEAMGCIYTDNFLCV